jgi:hypothetical protein
MKMVNLPDRVTVHIGKKKWRGEIPAALCPASLKKAARKAEKQEAEKAGSE